MANCGGTHRISNPTGHPSFSLASNYIGRLAVIRVAVAVQIGGFRGGFGDAEEWDLFFRLSRSAAPVPTAASLSVS